MNDPSRLMSQYSSVLHTAVSLAALLSGIAADVGNGAESLPTPAQFTPALESQIDRAAYATPVESLPREEVGFAGDIVAWIIARAPMRPEEERSRAETAHAELLTRVKRLATPPAAQAIFDRLLTNLPGHLRPSAFKYSLTVLDSAEHNAFNLGGGFVYTTASLLNLLLADQTHGADRLAFVLAHELGHIGLGHSRRGYQMQLLQQETQRGIAVGVDNARLQRFLVTTVNPTGSLVRFLYSHRQEYEADLFAVHLCRNSGFRLNSALDFVRWLCVQTHGPSITQNITQVNHATMPANPPASLAAYLAVHPDPLLRQKRLLLELTGQPESHDGYGLFEVTLPTCTFEIAASHSLAANERAIVFLHGMEGDRTAYSDLIRLIGSQPGASEIRLFAFSYPNDQSLACSGRFLVNELRRVCANCRQVDFVCHSAGGLVFRYYAEVHEGEFRHAIFQGTPHGGSDLAALRYLLEAGEFFGGLKLGFPIALQQTLVDGHGQITYDLHADSLFLRYLGRFPKPAANRYVIYRGRTLNAPEGFFLATAVGSTRELLKKKLAAKSSSTFLQQAALNAADRLVLPREISDGDFAVWEESANLPGVAAVNNTKLNHLTLKTDPAVMRAVARLLLTE